MPDWSVSCHVHALTTLRFGGYSQGVYESLNLALHVGDDPEAVAANRRLLQDEAMLPASPYWLTQTHGVGVVEVPTSPVASLPRGEFEADASVSFTPNNVCVVLTGDCLPVLLTNQSGTCVAAIHAGWKGLAAGVIEATVEKLLRQLQDPPETLIAWLGPAIGQDAFEVGEEVLQAFGPKTESAFIPCGKNVKLNKNTWKANLYELARMRLNNLNISRIFGGNCCTYSNPDQFFSARRSEKTGRMATLIWFTPQ